MTWATINDVRVIAGVTVTDEQRAIATGIVETLVGVFVGVARPDITDRDLEWLKRAVAYQAAWMVNHPDLFDREDVTSASQDGESVAFRNVDAHILAPLARKAIRRLSWRGIRALAPGGGTPPPVVTDVNSEAFDDRLPWRPM